MNFKRKKRRRGGVRGHCGMCMLFRYTDCHHRVETRQEKRSRDRMVEQLGAV